MGDGFKKCLKVDTAVENEPMAQSGGVFVKLGVIAEPEGEDRVAIVPNSIPKLSKVGFEVSVESGAGSSSSYSDHDYESKGAIVTSREVALSADILVTIHLPDSSELKNGQIIACVADPFRHPDRVKKCLELSLIHI